MATNDNNTTRLRPAGYDALIERYGVAVIPNWHRSFISNAAAFRINVSQGVTQEIYPSNYAPGDSLGMQLEFAIKYDGTNLGILDSLFRVIDEKEFLSFVQSKPTGKYARRLWFLFEFLTGKRLPLADLKHGNYVDLLDATEYYTLASSRQVRRQRINDNMLGGRAFCPTVRRTSELRRLDAADLPELSRKATSRYSPELMKRALSYLYTKETRSSFEIEHIKPDSSRAEKFAALLHTAEHDDYVGKAQLIGLQNRIVDPRFRDSNYRTTQNYVGETLGWQQERVQFASPKPEDLPGLMEGLIDSHRLMEAGCVFAVVHAAVVAYGFVFMHPFEDGNGRIHRFLIHNILARTGFTPTGLMFPVSASMLKNPALYNASLEAFSGPLMPLVEYTLDDEGRMTVLNGTVQRYRYIDMTPQVEALFGFIERTIATELIDELAFLAGYDAARKAIQEIVDMPDRQIGLFIRTCLGNNRRLSARKRASHFAFLTESEIARLEKALQRAFKLVKPGALPSP